MELTHPESGLSGWTSSYSHRLLCRCHGREDHLGLLYLGHTTVGIDESDDRHILGYPLLVQLVGKGLSLLLTLMDGEVRTPVAIDGSAEQ